MEWTEYMQIDSNRHGEEEMGVGATTLSIFIPREIESDVTEIGAEFWLENMNITFMPKIVWNNLNAVIVCIMNFRFKFGLFIFGFVCALRQMRKCEAVNMRDQLVIFLFFSGRWWSTCATFNLRLRFGKPNQRAIVVVPGARYADPEVITVNGVGYVIERK